MHKEIITCEKAVTAGAVRVLPVVKLSLTSLNIKGSVTFHVVKQPEYVIIWRDGKVALFNMSGEQVPISQAKSECPALEAALAGSCDFQLPPDW